MGPRSNSEVLKEKVDHREEMTLGTGSGIEGFGTGS
jgi:hypothetical protein